MKEETYERSFACCLRLFVLALLALSGCGEAGADRLRYARQPKRPRHQSISITPSTSTEWDTELVDGTFMDGETMDRNLGTYKESEVPDTWNILVYGEDNTILYDTTVDEVDFRSKTATISSSTRLKRPSASSSADGETLYADYEAAKRGPRRRAGRGRGRRARRYLRLIPAAGGPTGSRSTSSSTRTMNGSPSTSTVSRSAPAMRHGGRRRLTLCMEDGRSFSPLWQTAYGDLSDANGNALSSSDYIMLLPTPEDELNQTATFPGGFTNVTHRLSYPDGGA